MLLAVSTVPLSKSNLKIKSTNGKALSGTSIRADYFATANRWLRLSTVADYQERVAAAYEIPSLADGQHRTKLPLRRC